MFKKYSKKNIPIIRPKAEWAIVSEGSSKIQLVGQKYRDKTTLASKMRFSHHCFGFQGWRFSLLVGYNI